MSTSQATSIQIKYAYNKSIALWLEKNMRSPMYKGALSRGWKNIKCQRLAFESVEKLTKDHKQIRITIRNIKLILGG